MRKLCLRMVWVFGLVIGFLDQMRGLILAAILSALLILLGIAIIVRK